MRYIDPQKFIKARFANRVMPKWHTAVICFRGLRSSAVLVNRLHAVPVNQQVISGMDSPGDRPYVYETCINGTPIAIVAGCWWGGPQTAMLVEEFACMGVESIIGFGLAGSISRDLPKCAHIVASKGLVTDGTSRAYTKVSSVDADDKLLNILLSSKSNYEIVPVNIATVDAIYQETDIAVQEWTNLGAQAINMETTPLYAASTFCGVKSLWLGYISDCLVDNRWDDWWGLPESLDEQSADITISLLESIVSKQR